MKNHYEENKENVLETLIFLMVIFILLFFAGMWYILVSGMG